MHTDIGRLGGKIRCSRNTRALQYRTGTLYDSFPESPDSRLKYALNCGVVNRWLISRPGGPSS